MKTKEEKKGSDEVGEGKGLCRGDIINQRVCGSVDNKSFIRFGVVEYSSWTITFRSFVVSCFMSRKFY